MSETVNTGGAHGHEAKHAVRFERDDIQAGPVVWFVVGLIIMTALTFAGVYGMMLFFSKTEIASKKSTWGGEPEGRGKEVPLPVAPMVEGEDSSRFHEKLEPGKDALNRSIRGKDPRLEGFGLKKAEYDVGRIYPSVAVKKRVEELAYLESWSKEVGKEGTIHVPIEVAMSHLAKDKGPLPADEYQNAPSRSSSGRVSRTGDDAARGHDPSAPKEHAREDEGKGHEPAKQQPEEPKK